MYIYCIITIFLCSFALHSQRNFCYLPIYFTFANSYFFLIHATLLLLVFLLSYFFPSANVMSFIFCFMEVVFFTFYFLYLFFFKQQSNEFTIFNNMREEMTIKMLMNSPMRFPLYYKQIFGGHANNHEYAKIIFVFFIFVFIWKYFSHFDITQLLLTHIIFRVCDELRREKKM